MVTLFSFREKKTRIFHTEGVLQGFKLPEKLAFLDDSINSLFFLAPTFYSIDSVFGGDEYNEKSIGELSELCDLEQVFLKPELQAHHCLTTWLQIRYRSLLWGDSIRKGADLESRSAYSASTPR